jgi:hypothetical protein
VKHAGAAALDALEPVLAAVRAIGGGATERSRGIFYVRGRAVLHFHEDAAGLFADARLGGPDGPWTRLRVSTAPERRRFVSALRKGWAPAAPRHAP